mmetsp:Transcript_115579/g.367465  ORF Transcript_115579/g.367465 Transcript_115579/m.367465 type:complete len:845 (+) Transcript_115579:222-2756(+)
METASDVEDDVFELKDAEWRYDRLLRFIDPRIEARYCFDMFGQRRRMALALSAFWGSICIVEFFVVGGLERISDQDIAANVTAWGRIFLMVVTFLAGALIKLNIADIESAFSLVLFSAPVVLCLNHDYRSTRLFGGDYYHRKEAHCGAETCTDDSKLILVLLLLLCTPLLLSMRFAKVWMLCPWSASVYGAFSFFGLGPLTLNDHIIIVFMFASVCGFLLVGIYRIESDLRRKWGDNLQLRTQMLIQQVELRKHQQWLFELEERLAAANEPEHMPVDPWNSQFEEAPQEVLYTVPGPLARGSTSAPVLRSGMPPEEPNALLVATMAGRSLDESRLRRMAERITHVSYGMTDFFEDVVGTFSELDLFFANGSMSTSSGVSAEEEYQRTVGAFFAVYWLLRLGADGKQGFCFGMDEVWKTKAGPAVAESSSDKKKRHKFYENMEWSYVEGVVSEAVGKSVDRIQAMLCLTAFHDIMKVKELCPKVSNAHAPYAGYKAGEVIYDHDLALAYVLEHYPNLLPSFRGLPQASREVILFTQGKMHFNHGWFVQAEAPPGAMLTKFKGVLHNATRADLAFYYFHWLTDLSGAEGRPLAGAEKFVLRFPLAVLSAFLWSIPYLQRLKGSSETEVVESYLEARFASAMPDVLPPTDGTSIAVMRLVVMAQSAGGLVVEAFRQSPKTVQHLLATELARTGLRDQSFVRSPQEGGPALFVYYGPALLQRCERTAEMIVALRVLSAIYHAARLLWPVSDDQAGQTVMLEAGRLKAHASEVVAGQSSIDGKIMVLESCSSMEGVVSLVVGTSLNGLIASGVKFLALETSEACVPLVSCLYTSSSDFIVTGSPNRVTL